MRILLLGIVTAACLLAGARAQDLDGLWAAEKRFGPEARGVLVVERRGAGYVAEIGGRVAPAGEGGALAADFADGAGAFRGRIVDGGRAVDGWWIQPPANAAGGQRLASPVRLAREAEGRWSGVVAPYEDTLTFFLPVKTDAKGVARTWLLNPERNIGLMMRADRLEREAGRVRLVGKFPGGGDDAVLAEGSYDGNNDALVLRFPQFGTTLDFRRADGEAAAERAFRPRRDESGTTLASPPARDDGWATGDVEAAGLDRAMLAAFVDTLASAPMENVGTPQVHALLIARRGKLVVEEYFHGFDRTRAHDTRSASKSLTAMLVGAEMRGDRSLTEETRLVDAVDPSLLPATVDPRLKEVRLRDLLTMSPGFDCDDRDPQSRGAEDVMQSQRAEPNWWRYALAVPMARAPGEKAVYCSMNANLLGAALSRASGRFLPDLFAERIARPLDMRRYFLNIAPNGEPYLGGGAFLEPRDFLKLPQLVLDGGVWRGRRVFDAGFARRMASPLVPLREIRYGYLWWSMDLPYKDGVVRAVFAGGNGGQLAMAVPDLGLAVVFMGGNYGDGPATLRAQREYVPQAILPAVRGR